jgi:hypothetical protein
MKKIIIVVMCLLIAPTLFNLNQANSQELFKDTTWFKEKKLVFGADIITVGLTSEYNFKPTHTVKAMINLSPSFYSMDGQNGDRENGFILNPYFMVNYRYYHNIERRKRLNKNLSYFSGNYIAVVGQILLVPRTLVIQSPFFVAVMYRHHYTGVQYGIQRGFGKTKKWFVDGHLGAGLKFREKGAPYSLFGGWGYVGIGRRID